MARGKPATQMSRDSEAVEKRQREEAGRPRRCSWLLSLEPGASGPKATGHERCPGLPGSSRCRFSVARSSRAAKMLLRSRSGLRDAHAVGVGRLAVVRRRGVRHLRAALGAALERRHALIVL